MKHAATIFVATIFTAMSLVPDAYAQEEPADTMQTQFVMLNQNTCPGENMEELVELFETDLAPVFSEMEEEGEINDWGLLTHAWGDEYNFNFFVITDSHRAFVDAWDSFIERSQEASPEGQERFFELCEGNKHKDNMYMLHKPGETGQPEGMR